MKLTACFNGCSLTEGEGFLPELKDQFVYDRVLSEKFNFNRINIAEPGSSNYKIFMRTLPIIDKKQCDILFVQWSGLNRIWLSPGPETYYVAMPNKNIKYYQYRDIKIQKDEKYKFETTLSLFNHDYQNILDLIDYCNVLEKLSKIQNIKIVFINGLVPWQNDLVNVLNTNLSESLSTYTKNILDFDNRDDEEILKFVNVLQTKFLSLNQDLWVNLFDAFNWRSIDKADDGKHPGVKSHAWLADQVSSYLIKNKTLMNLIVDSTLTTKLT
jgi:hypothetical protein